MKRRSLLQATSAVIAMPSLAWAQDKYPSKPITLICPYAAGGNADQRSRQIGRFISTALGQPVIVDNKPGAGGNIGTEAIARAKPDGYTIGMGNFAPLAVNPTMFKKMNFDPAKDLVPVSLIEKGPLVLMVPANSPFKSVKDIMAAAKASPGKLSFASGGLGGSHHLSGEMFKSLAGLSITHIPYKGGAPAKTDLMEGQVDMMFDAVTTMSEFARSGKVKAIATTGKARSSVLPNVPTLSEAGVVGYEAVIWLGLMAPKGTPPEIVKRLNAEVVKIVSKPEVRDEWAKQGAAAMMMNPDEFARYVNDDIVKWERIVKISGAKPDQ